jgi:hypothetical protein
MGAIPNQGFGGVRGEIITVSCVATVADPERWRKAVARREIPKFRPPNGVRGGHEFLAGTQTEPPEYLSKPE